MSLPLTHTEVSVLQALNDRWEAQRRIHQRDVQLQFVVIETRLGLASGAIGETHQVNLETGMVTEVPRE